MDRTSISSRAAQWAANHRRAAILGWIAFVAIAFLIGGAVGTKTIAGRTWAGTPPYSGRSRPDPSTATWRPRRAG